jgi:predicted Zn-dependent protease with MMP-like domain
MMLSLTSHFGMMICVVRLTDEEFEELVSTALDGIPPELSSAMDNVVVQIDDFSPPGRLFGLYEGVPLTKRGQYSAAMPDRITIFKETICAACKSAQEVEHQVRKTVIHEVGHHFGIGDARLRELGW